MFSSFLSDTSILNVLRADKFLQIARSKVCSSPRKVVVILFRLRPRLEHVDKPINIYLICFVSFLDANREINYK